MIFNDPILRTVLENCPSEVKGSIIRRALSPLFGPFINTPEALYNDFFEHVAVPNPALLHLIAGYESVAHKLEQSIPRHLPFTAAYRAPYFLEWPSDQIIQWVSCNRLVSNDTLDLIRKRHESRRHCQTQAWRCNTPS